MYHLDCYEICSRVISNLYIQKLDREEKFSEKTEQNFVSSSFLLIVYTFNPVMKS